MRASELNSPFKLWKDQASLICKCRLLSWHVYSQTEVNKHAEACSVNRRTLLVSFYIISHVSVYHSVITIISDIYNLIKRAKLDILKLNLNLQITPN